MSGPGGGMKEASVLRSSVLIDGPKRIVRETLRMPDGVDIEWTYVDTPPSVIIVPITDGGDVVFVRQYRHNLKRYTLELPAGSVRPGESATNAAMRELSEETGYFVRKPSEFEPLGDFYSLPSETNKWSSVFLARTIEMRGGPTGDSELEPYFDLEVELRPLSAAVGLVGSELVGMETVGALLMAVTRLTEEGRLEGRASGP